MFSFPEDSRIQLRAQSGVVRAEAWGLLYLLFEHDVIANLTLCVWWTQLFTYLLGRMQGG